MATTTMTTNMVNNMFSAIDTINNLPATDFDTMLSLWDKAFYDDDSAALSDLKDFCKANNIIFKYAKMWLLDEI